MTSIADLAVGQAVRRRGLAEIGIIRSVSGAGCRVSFPSGTSMLHIEDLEPAPEGPEDRLLAGEMGNAEEHVLRLRAEYLQHAYRNDPLASLNNARIEPQWHQVLVAHRVARKLRPRMILADEVGLGKTIEAGLIIKELRARQQIERVLIVAPASLARQWQSELSSKFNESFEIVDGPAAKFLSKNGSNPFLARDNVICSLPFATVDKRAEQIVEAGWDLVVFDEAHRVRRTRAKETKAYAFADELKEGVEGLLLLTATPVQLDAYELYSLIQLVEPGLYRNEKAFEARRHTIPELNRLMLLLEGWAGMEDDKRQVSWGQHRSRLQRAGCTSPEDLDDAERHAEILERVLLEHPLADVMVRNRKAELGLAGRRQAITESVELTELERELYDDVTSYIQEGYGRARRDKTPQIGFIMVTYQKMLTSSSHALRTSFRKRIAALQAQQRSGVQRKKAVLLGAGWDDPEELSEALGQAQEEYDAQSLDWEIAQLQDLAERLDHVRDSKVRHLLQLVERVLRESPESKLVVFTQFIETQLFLTRALEANGVSTTVFNGTMSTDGKEKAVQAFRERAAVLVSTEAGGEGRNLQFANHLVNFDLPWNPMKVEQRIGRLDRIGQKRTVVIHNLVAEGTLEERILDVLANRIRIFEESVGALDPILGGIEKDIERVAFEDRDLAVGFAELSAQLEGDVRRARATEAKLKDFVMDRASLRRDQLNRLRDTPPLADQDDVADFCHDALDQVGGVLVEHEQAGQDVRLSPRAAARLGLAQSAHGVFSASEALRHEELDFFAFGHPLVDRLVQHFAQREGADVGARQSSEFHGGPRLEVVYRTSSTSREQGGRLTRHTIGADLQVHSAPLRSSPSGKGCSARLPDWLPQALEASRAHFEREFLQLRAQHQRAFESERRERLQRRERLFDYQRDRLELQIESARAWLAEREETAGARDQRIIPARRGKLKKAVERLAALREEYEVDRDRIATSEASFDGDVLWTSLLVGAP